MSRTYTNEVPCPLTAAEEAAEKEARKRFRPGTKVTVRASGMSGKVTPDSRGAWIEPWSPGRGQGAVDVRVELASGRVEWVDTRWLVAR